jgi:predicted DNA-binding transcriptional regulator AlpA
MQTKIDKETSAIEPGPQRPSRGAGLGTLRGAEILPHEHKAAGPPEVAILNHRRGLMSAPQLAERLNVSLSWVNKAHVYGTGPPAVRVGRRRLYDPLDVDNWLATKRQQNTSEQI